MSRRNATRLRRSSIGIGALAPAVAVAAVAVRGFDFSVIHDLQSWFRIALRRCRRTQPASLTATPQGPEASRPPTTPQTASHEASTARPPPQTPPPAATPPPL